MGGQSTSRWKGKRPRRGTAPGWIRGAFLVAAVSLGGAVFSAACSGEDQLRPPGTQGTTTSSGTGTSSGTCDEGEQRDCSVTISEHNGVLTCMDGTQSCVGGEWTACSGENMRTRLAPWANQAEDGTAFSLSLPTDCIDNPCDPSCQVFNEDPATDITIPPVLPPFPWNVGDINGLPPAIAKKGSNEPCTTSEDCQFDQYCENPSQLACSHHPCATGSSTTSVSSANTGLNATCSPCVQKICAQDPTCCQATAPVGCDHDPCLQGVELKQACQGPGGCVEQICSARKGCCSYDCRTQPPGTQDAWCQAYTGSGASLCSPGTGLCSCAGSCGANNSSLCSGGLCRPRWNAQCVTMVGSTCGKSCAVNTWDSDCVNMVGSECGAICEDGPGTCAHDVCYTGDPLALGCDPCVAAVCAAKGACCATAWDQSCVDLVPIHCQNAGQPKTCPPKGQCTAWTPGTWNDSCSLPDLTVGVPCGGTVPVCNRGSAPVPAGTPLNIVSWAPSTGSFPSSAPNKVLNSCNPATPGTAACSHTLAAALAPGQCVSVAGCNGLAVNSEIMVNPAGAGHINECLCENNWSVYRNDACTSPACVASASVAFVKKLTMFVAIDASSSMQCTGTGCPTDAVSCPAGQTFVGDQRWIPMKNALSTFFSDPASAGTTVALRFWPDDTPALCGTSPCPATGAGNGCAVPRALATLSADPAPADTGEQALKNALAAKAFPCGNTPTYSGLDGATYWAINRKIANPNEEVIVVMLSDGQPSHCNTDGGAIKGLAQNAYYNYGVRTYVLGFGETQEGFVVELAQSGGGRSFYMNLTGNALQTKLLEAMKSIRGDVTPCNVSIPVDALTDANGNPMPPDPSEITVIYTSSANVQQTLTYVADPASCVANGWYLDPVDPSIGRLCPQTCQVVQADPGGRVQATVPCTTSISPTTYTQTYHAECPQGSKVQWGLLRWDSTTPSDSRVEFSVRTAEATADLPSATPHSAGVAQAAPTNTQICDTSGPAPLCPVDLYTALGELPDARQDYLELTMTLVPAADQVTAPTVHNWEITYSCPYSE